MTKTSLYILSQVTASYQAVTLYSRHTYNHLTSTHTMSKQRTAIVGAQI